MWILNDCCVGITLNLLHPQNTRKSTAHLKKHFTTVCEFLGLSHSQSKEQLDLAMRNNHFVGHRKWFLSNHSRRAEWTLKTLWLKQMRSWAHQPCACQAPWGFGGNSVRKWSHGSHICFMLSLLQAVTPICFSVSVALCVACVERYRSPINYRPVPFLLWEMMREQVAKQAVVTVFVPPAPWILILERVENHFSRSNIQCCKSQAVQCTPLASASSFW